MGIFSRKYTESNIYKVGINKLIKLLNNKDESIVKLAEEAINKFLNNEHEKKIRLETWGGTYWDYEKKWFIPDSKKYEDKIQRFETAKTSNPEINIDSAIQFLTQEKEECKTKYQKEIEEFENLSINMGKDSCRFLGVGNLRRIISMLEKNEIVDEFIRYAPRGTLMQFNDYDLYTNKCWYLLRGWTNDPTFGRINRIRYDSCYNIEEKHGWTPNYDIFSKDGELAESFNVKKDSKIISKLGKYGTQELKDMMKQLGLLKEEVLVS